MFDSAKAKWFAGSVAAACIAAVPFLPPALATIAAGTAAVATALVNFWNGKPPEDRSGSGGVRIVPPGLFLICIVLAGCGAGVKDVVWPTAAKCLPAPGDVMNDVFAALKNDPGGSLSERALKLLEGLARKHGAVAIVCAANEIADRLAADGDPESARVSNKARAFVEHTETRVQE